jgi:hypothetical protein
MANSYIPRSDHGALNWMKAFANGIGTNPFLYFLSSADAANIHDRVSEFESALRLTSEPGTKTKVTVNRKDEARNVAQQLCEHFASLIKPNAGISDDAKIAIGVRPLNRGRSRVKVPASSPLLKIIGATPGSQTLRYNDTSTPTSRGKPHGAMFLEVRVAVGDEIAQSVDEARPAGLFTRNPIGVTFTSDDDRKKATYWARWVSRRGEFGPWSAPVSMSIAA